MPLFEYILVALLGSGGAPSAPPSVTLNADALIQPNGGALSVGQETPKKDDSNRIKRSADVGLAFQKKSANYTRHKRSHRPIKRIYTPKKEGS
jgi:hypothetical protein